MFANFRPRLFLILTLLGLVLSFVVVQGLLADDATPTNLVTIEGPVQAIGGNAITISGINIQVGPNDPVWSNLQIGDVVRVQANSVQQNNTTVLVAVVIIIVIDVDTVTSTPTTTPTVTPESTSEVTPSATPTPGTPTPGTPTPTLTTTPTSTGMPVIIVIEGPVQAININIITIYNINIQVDVNDPILTVIQIGDIVRVSGNIVDDDDDGNTTIIIIAVTVVIVNVDVVIIDGDVWRDSGNCSNPPPPWAPANGWRRRCENPSPGGSGMGMGMGMGMGGSGS